MRVSTSQMFQQSVDSMMASSSAVSQAQQNITNGGRVNSASQDVTAVKLSSQLLLVQKQAAVFSANIDELDTRFAEADASLASVGNALQHLNELMTQSRNGALSANDLAALASQANLDATAVGAEMNRTDSQGRKIYSYTSAEVGASLDDATARAAAASSAKTAAEHDLLTARASLVLASEAFNVATSAGQPLAIADAQTVLTAARAEVNRLGGDPHASEPGGVISVETANLAAANAAVTTWLGRKASLADSHPKLEVRPGQVMDTEVLFSAANLSDLQGLDPQALAKAVTGTGKKSSFLQMSAAATQAAINALPSDPSDQVTKDQLKKLQDQLDSATKFEAAQNDLKTSTDPDKIVSANRTIASRQAAVFGAQDQDRADAETTISNLLDATLQARGKVGANWSVLTDYQDTNQSFVLAAQQSLSKMQDTDVAKSVSDLANYQAQLQAARAIFNRIQSATSLFDLIR